MSAVTTSAWPGSHQPLGATWDAESTNFAVFAPEATVGRALPVRRGDGDGPVETRYTLTEQTLGIWHGALPGLAPGQRYGFRADGPWEPARGRVFNPAKLLLDPYARAVSGAVRPGRPDLRLPAGPPSRDLDDVRAAQRGPRCDVDSAPYVAGSVVVHDDFDWGDDDAGPAAAPVDRHRRLRAARQGVHPAARRRCPRRSAGPTPG